jgi:hypothetical protein
MCSLAESPRGVCRAEEHGRAAGAALRGRRCAENTAAPTMGAVAPSPGT